MEGKVCKKCGEWKEWKEFHKKSAAKDGHESQCKMCRKRYRENNKEKRKDTKKRHYVKHRELILKKSQEYYNKNCEKIKSDRREYIKSYRKKNKGKIAASSITYYQKNKERLRKKRKENHKQNPQIATDAWRKRRGAIAKARGFFTDSEFQALIKAYSNRCYYCLMKLKKGKIQADHWLPLSKGGDNSISNIVPACNICNLSKHAKYPWDFKEGESISSKKLPEQWKQDNNL